jgi:hypothetical protein
LRAEQENSASRKLQKRNKTAFVAVPGHSNTNPIWPTHRNAAGRNHLLRARFSKVRNAPTTAPSVSPASSPAGSVVAIVGLTSRPASRKDQEFLIIWRAPERDLSKSMQLALTHGCCGVISVGVAGGLCPDLRPGDCIVASGTVDFRTLWPTQIHYG